MLLPILVCALPDITSLPPPLVEGYGLQPGSAVARTDMDAGAARQRRRFTAVTEICPVTWRFRADEMATFRAWFDDAACQGAAWFLLTLPDGRSTATGPRQCRFLDSGAGPWQATALKGLHWEVSARLEVRNA